MADVNMDEDDIEMEEAKASNSNSSSSSSSSSGSSAAPEEASSSAEAVAAAVEVIPPNKTLYVNNINEKVKLEVLKKQLYMVFSQYGKVVEVSASKSNKRRGQAWVIYEELEAATKALGSKQGFNFYDKPLRLAFAKAKANSEVAKEVVQNSQKGKAKRGRGGGEEEAGADKKRAATSK